MSKQLKALITETMRSRFEGIDEACVMDLTGLNVADTMVVRRELATHNLRMMVVKNSLTRRAFADGPLERLGKELRGPCALVTGGDSIIDTAREMVRLAKTFPQITLKQALMSGELEVMDVSALAKMKARSELMSELAQLIGSPGRALASCISSAGGRIAGCLQTLADR